MINFSSKWFIIFFLLYGLCLEIHSWIEPIQQGRGLVRALSDLLTTINICWLIYWVKQD